MLTRNGDLGPGTEVTLLFRPSGQEQAGVTQFHSHYRSPPWHLLCTDQREHHAGRLYEKQALTRSDGRFLYSHLILLLGMSCLAINWGEQ